MIQIWPEAPFGVLRGMWRRQHCLRLNPYGSDTCPYAKSKCGQEFVLAVRASANAEQPTRYFSRVARNAAARRADNKPLARGDGSQVELRTDEQKRSGDPGGGDKGQIPGCSDDADARHSAEAGADLYRSDHRPERIGELLGQINLRSHQGRTKNGKEGQK